jgi:cell division protein FtsZ
MTLGFVENADDSDAILQGIVDTQRTRTAVIGIGGAGNNTISRLQAAGCHGITTIAVDTDAQSLYFANSDQKLLLGKRATRGWGTGGDLRLGEVAAEEDIPRIRQLTGKDLVFLTCGLGGGTSSGAAPIVAREAHAQGAIVVSLVTLPFNAEGGVKKLRGYRGLRAIAEYSDTVILIPNDRLLELAPQLSLVEGFQAIDEFLIQGVKAVISLISNCGLVNLDFADVRGLLAKRPDKAGFIGTCEVDEGSSVQERVLQALQSPLLMPDVEHVDSALVSITGPYDLNLRVVNEVVETVANSIAPDATIKFGATIDPALGKRLKVIIIGSGPKSPLLRAAEGITQ